MLAALHAQSVVMDRKFQAPTPPHNLNIDFNIALLHLQIKADIKVNAG